MANEKEQKFGCMEWKVTMNQGSAEPHRPVHRAWKGLLGLGLTVRLKVWGFLKKGWEIGVNEPRKVIHGFKVGLALSIVSLFYYVRPLYDGIGGTGISAVMTVAVVMEFTVGGTIYRAFNRTTATLLAVSLAIGIHFLADKSGEKIEPVIRGASVFLIALVVSFARFIPQVKNQYDYGMITFIVTFALVSVSGYRVGELVELAEHRCTTIALGCSICVIVGMLVNPIWAGVDLHLLAIRNMEKLATSLDGCVLEYFKEGSNIDCKEEWCQVLQGYKAVLNSKASEDSLANLARWEPAHGQFGFHGPWQKYLKVCGSMRYCASCIEALHAYIISDIQPKASEHMKKHISSSFIKLSSQSSDLLKELANSTKKMTKSSSIDLLVTDMGLAMGELQLALKSLPNQMTLQTPSCAEENMKKLQHKSALPLVEIMPLITLASLLIEVSARILGVVDAVNELADDNFSKPATEKTELSSAISHLESEGKQGVEVAQQV